MISKNKSTGRRVLGCATVWLLSLVIANSAWALDLDQSLADSIQQKNSDSAQIMKTLGRGKKVNEHTTRRTKKKVYVVLFKAHARKKV